MSEEQIITHGIYTKALPEVEIITTELKKFDPIVPKIDEIAALYMPLKIASIDDTEGYEAVREAIKFMVKKRNEVEQKRKELKADSLALGRALDSRAKEITAMLEPIETHLVSEKNKIDLEIKRIEELKEAKRLAAIQERADRLTNIGMFHGVNEFIWKSAISETEITLLNINLETLSDAYFDEFYERTRTLINEEVAEIKRQEEIRIAEAQRVEAELLAEKLRMEEELNKIKAEREEIEKQRMEIAKQVEEIQNQRATTRTNALIELGLVIDTSWWGLPPTERTLMFIPMMFIPLVSQYSVKTQSDEEWSIVIAEIRTEVVLWKDLEQTAKQEREEAMRKKVEAEIEAKRAEEAKQIEAQRLADLADAEEREKLDKKIKSHKKDLKCLEVFFYEIKTEADNRCPELISEFGKAIHNEFLETLNKFIKTVKP